MQNVTVSNIINSQAQIPVRHFPVCQIPACQMSVRYFPVRHFSSPVHSTLATSYVIFQSCNFQSCKFSYTAGRLYNKHCCPFYRTSNLLAYAAAANYTVIKLWGNASMKCTMSTPNLVRSIILWVSKGLFWINRKKTTKAAVSKLVNHQWFSSGLMNFAQVWYRVWWHSVYYPRSMLRNQRSRSQHEITTAKICPIINKSAKDCSISLKFGKDFIGGTTDVQGQGGKSQGNSVI